MSPGVAILLAVLGLFGLMVGMRALLAHKARALEGQPVPELPGPLGTAVQGTTLLWFHSPTCGPCRSMRKPIGELEASGAAHSVDVSTDMHIAQAFGVMATPTTIKIVDGRIQSVRTGALTPGQLTALREA